MNGAGCGKWSGVARRVAFRCAILVPAIVMSSRAVEHFPMITGARWHFSYHSYQGGWGGGTTSYGTVDWEILSVAYLESFPVQHRIRIAQRTAITRRVYTPTIAEDDGVGYDSTFTEPQIERDTLVICGVEGVNGLWFEQDSCWSFVHDPDDSLPPNGETLGAERVFYDGDSLDAVTVETRECRTPAAHHSSCGKPRYFLTVDGIGPVGYRRASDPCLADWYESERWWLESHWSPGVVGGPCEYDTIVGQARITRITPGDGNRFEGYFAFTPHGAAPPTLDLQPEYPLSAVTNDPGARELRIKTGHVYPCTLRVIEEGTCTPMLWAFGMPADREGYDTSLIWIEPDSVREGDSIAVHLLSYEFTCANRFEHKSVSINEDVVNLTYRTDRDPTVECADRTGILYGTSFVLDELAAGTYRVYSFQPVSYYHLQCSDTLLVVKSTRATGSVPHRGKEMAVRAVRTPDGGARILLHVPGPMIGTVRVYTAAGALAGECPLVTTGAGVVPVDLGEGARGSGAYVVTVEAFGASGGVARRITIHQ